MIHPSARSPTGWRCALVSVADGVGPQFSRDHPSFGRDLAICLMLPVEMFAWALARVLGPPYTGPALVGFFALSSSIANGLLACDVGCKGQSPVALLHNITGLAGFVAAVAAMLVLARRWRRDPTWRPHARFTRRAAIVALASLLWFVATQATDAQSFAGIAQRIFAGALLLWITLTAARLLRQPTPADQLATRPVVEADQA